MLLQWLVFIAALLGSGVVLFFLARWVTRLFTQGRDSKVASISVTRAGMVWVAIQVALMVLLAVLFNYYPNNAFIRWLATPTGLAIALLGLLVIFGLIGAVLGRRGIELYKRVIRDA